MSLYTVHKIYYIIPAYENRIRLRWQRYADMCTIKCTNKLLLLII